MSPERHYTSLRLDGKEGRVCWIAEKNGGTRQIILDAKGNEAFSIECERIFMDSSYGDSDESNVQYFKIEKNGKWGICDLNGDVICPPEYDSCWLSDYGKTLHREGE